MLPKKIKVGCFNLQIRQIKNLATDYDRWGEFNPRDLTINIEESSAPQRQWETLFHEIVEAIDEQHELALPHPVIKTLGSAIFQVVKDNNLGCIVTNDTEETPEV